ncbi:MAG: PAS domain S-box protein, partial [Bacteroidales bacterium]|nr:PAS domain S-box protein [Bacteroidales bacterium]
GCSSESVIGKDIHEFSPDFQPNGESSQQKANNILAIVCSGKPQVFDWQHKRPNGEVFDVSVSFNKVELEDSTYIQAVLRDITEKKVLENKLIESENRYKEIFNNTSDSIIIQDADSGSILDVNLTSLQNVLAASTKKTC